LGDLHVIELESGLLMLAGGEPAYVLKGAAHPEGRVKG
jgi:hypothetical protein